MAMVLVGMILATIGVAALAALGLRQIVRMFWRVDVGEEGRRA
jgi:hypothetical protein